MAANSKIFIAFSVIGLILFYLISTNPLKTTDPSNPKFNASKFKFTDYNLKELSAIFDRLFPLGTERKFIENTLVSSGGAWVDYSNGIVIYSWTPSLIYFPKGIPAWGHGFDINTHHVAVLYDSNNKAIATQSSVGGGFNYQTINNINDSVTDKLLSPSALAAIKEKRKQGEK